jgi:hypothetical protein
VGGKYWSEITFAWPPHHSHQTVVGWATAQYWCWSKSLRRPLLAPRISSPQL